MAPRRWRAMRWRAMRWKATLLVGILVAGGTSACGSERVTDPERATTCDELVDAGRAVAEAVLDRLVDRSVDRSAGDPPEDPTQDRSSGTAVDPYEDVRRLMRTEAFQRRAGELGCGEADLRRRACTAYRGLPARFEGGSGEEAARQFLAPYFAACD